MAKRMIPTTTRRVVTPASDWLSHPTAEMLKAMEVAKTAKTRFWRVFARIRSSEITRLGSGSNLSWVGGQMSSGGSEPK